MRQSITDRIAAAPESVRRKMLADRASLPPGAAAVTGRFFAALAARGEPIDAPGPGAFQDAARSESTLATLLRALDRYAPQVSTSSGRDLRRAYYKARSGAGEGTADKPAAAVPIHSPANWPLSWRRRWPALRSAPIRDSSKTRYFASISRCADTLPHLDLPAGINPDRLGYFIAFSLGAAFLDAGVRPRTVAGYIGGLVALMRHSDGDMKALNGLRAVQDHFLGIARSGGKVKHDRIAHLMSQGGFAHIARTVDGITREASNLPAHSARAERLRRTGAVLILLINKPARTGDVATWRLGHELCRDPQGRWTLNWRQRKTGIDTGAGQLWPETGDRLDDLLLNGRPGRLADTVYEQKRGLNWLTGGSDVPSARLPSDLVRAAIGIPAHDLRTFAADYLRLHDPETAAATIQSHLGHGTRAAGEEYRSLAEGDAAAAAWRLIRDEIGKNDACSDGTVAPK